MVRSKQVRPATLVSTDKARWIAAAKLKGLFQDERKHTDSAKAKVKAPAPSRVRPPESQAVPHSLPWPIVRVERGVMGRNKVTLFRQAGISLTTTRQSVSDEMLHFGKETKQEQGQRWSALDWTRQLAVHISSESIQEVRVRRKGFITDAYWWNHFTVQTVDGEQHHFRVSDREVPHVNEALREIAGSRFIETPSRSLSRGEIATTLLALVSMTLVAMAWAYSLIELLIPGLILFVLVVLIAIVLAIGKKRSEFQPGGSPRKKRRRRLAIGKSPFRSQVLGWSIKTIGLCYVFVMIGVTSSVKLLPNEMQNWQFLWLVYLPGIGALVLGYRLCLRTFDPRKHPDPRSPILYLRTFDDDDAKTFQPTSSLAKLHGIFRYSEIFNASITFILHPTKLAKLFLNAETYSSEELFAKAFRLCGPLVAIGRPGEVLATSGADRMYVPDDAWQQVVLDYMAKSQAVVLQPAQTDGVRWEIEQVFARVPRHRILLSMLNFKDRPNVYEDFRAWLLREHRVALPLSVPFHDVPACIYFESDGSVRAQPICYRSPLFWSFVGNAVNLSKTFDPFIRGLHGGQREPPNHPNRSWLQAALSIPVAIGIALGFVELVALTQIMAKPHAMIALDVAEDRFSAAVINPQPAKITVYHGRAIPYEFRLDSDWKSAPIPSQAAGIEYSFDYRSGLGKLQVLCNKDVRFEDLYSDSLPQERRRVLETGVRQAVPDAIVEVTGSRWVEINGQQWRELSFVQRYSAVLGETRHDLFTSGPSGSLILSIIMPNHEHYKAIRDGVFATVKIPDTDIDLLLRTSKEAKQIEYRGKKAAYGLTLNSAWRAFDFEKELSKIGETGRKLKELAGGGVDFTFQLGESLKFASLEIAANPGDLDVRAVGKADCEEFLLDRQVGLETALPGIRVQCELLEFKKVTVRTKDWVEIRTRQVVSKKEWSRQTLVITRITSHNGRILGLTAEINHNHPAVHPLVMEALDSIQLEK